MRSHREAVAARDCCEQSRVIVETWDAETTGDQEMARTAAASGPPLYTIVSSERTDVLVLWLGALLDV